MPRKKEASPPQEPVSGIDNRFEIYRAGTLGMALLDSLDDLVTTGQIVPHAAMTVLKHFDDILPKVLSERVKARLTFKGRMTPHLQKFDDNIHWMTVKDVSFRTDAGVKFDVGELSIVACKARDFKDGVGKAKR